MIRLLKGDDGAPMNLRRVLWVVTAMPLALGAHLDGVFSGVVK
jgi:hypothetical protein